MTKGERVREVRKYLNLTLEKFGENIGLRKSSISQIENNVNDLSEQVTKSICREYNVDYIWLTTGVGKMTPEMSRDEKITLWVSKITKEPISDMDDFKIRFIEALSDLDVGAWKGILEFAEGLIKKE